MWCAGFSLPQPLLLHNTGSRAFRLQWMRHVASVVVTPGLESIGSVVVAHGLSCLAACGILLDQGLNLCLLHWQADCLPVSHQGSPKRAFSFFKFWLCWVLLLLRLFSSCGAQASHCSGFSCGAWALGCSGFTSCSSQALEHRLNSLGTQA